MNAPRLRDDLRSNAVTVVDDDLLCFDVRDPRSGGQMRLFDHEWKIAEKMDGTSTFEQLAEWAAGNVGFSPSASDLRQYARRLLDLGFFEPNTSIPDEPVAMPPAPPRPITAPSLPVAAPAALPPPGDIDIPMPLMTEPETEPVSTAGFPASAPPPPAPPPPPPPAMEQPGSPSPLGALHVQVTPTSVPAVAAPAAAPPITVMTPAPPEVRVTAPPRKHAISPGFAWTVVLLLLAGIGGIAYFYLIEPLREVQRVAVAPAPQPTDVVRYHEATAKATAGEQLELSFGASGNVVDIVPVGTETKPGMALASLDSYAKLQKDLADVRDRLAYYEAKVSAPKGDVKRNRRKVAEKQARIERLEARIAKARIVASTEAVVSAVTVESGAPVSAGSPVIKLGGKGLRAQFDLPPGDAAKQKVEDVVEVATEDGKNSVDANVVAIDEGKLTVELTGEGASAIPPGTELRLVKTRMPDLIRVPLAALAKAADGSDQVFILVEGHARARPVKISEKTDTEAYVITGISAGDQIITSGAGSLIDGQKATAQ